MRINLLPPEYRPQPVINPVRLVVMIVGSIVCLASLGFAIYQYSLLHFNRIKLDNVKKELSTYDVYKAQLETIDKLQTQVDTYKKELKQFEDVYQLHLQIINGIAGSLSEQVWINKLKIASDGKIALEGGALDFVLVGHVLEKLNKMKEINLCKLKEIKEVKNETLTTYDFIIEMNSGRALQYGRKK